MEDDSYFYTQIAYNLGVNHFSSFDGINITSGYHLIWGWILGFLSFLISFFSHSKEIHLFIFFVFYFYLAINTSLYFGKNILEKVIIFSIFIFFNILMETALLSLLLLYFSYIFFVQKDTDNCLGYISIFFIPLIRIDGIIFLFFPLLYLFYNKASRNFALRLSLILFSGIITYFILMYSCFGHFFSVSALYKALSGKSMTTILVWNFSSYAKLRSFFLIFLIIIACWELIKRKKYDQLSILMSLILFFVIHLFTNLIRYWYFMPIYTVTLFLLFQSSKKN